ncbi:PIN-like domain-containing protein [Streptomyces shaanxiensis]
MVAPDANVLLNLYRYTEQARTDLLGALGALGDRLWVPHQVVDEFWRNRESVISEARSTSKNASQEMSRPRRDGGADPTHLGQPSGPERRGLGRPPRPADGCLRRGAEEDHRGR